MLSCHRVIFDFMKTKEKKKTFTYATIQSVKDKAKVKAFKEGVSLSEKIDQLLRVYIKSK